MSTSVIMLKVVTMYFLQNTPLGKKLRQFPSLKCTTLLSLSCQAVVCEWLHCYALHGGTDLHSCERRGEEMRRTVAIHLRKKRRRWDFLLIV